jgi:hypothetical protein
MELRVWFPVGFKCGTGGKVRKSRAYDIPADDKLGTALLMRQSEGFNLGDGALHSAFVCREKAMVSPD